MANFFVPYYEPSERYQMTTDGGYSHPWKMQVGIGSDEYGVIGLYGGYDRTENLNVVSNNPGIITVSEAPPKIPLSPGAWPNEDRFFTIIGQKDGFTILDALGKYGPWCSIQIEVGGGYCRPEESGIFVETNQWTLEFEPDLDPLGYNLPNGVRIPLPPRGRLWPKRSSTAKIGRAINDNQSVIYTVVLTPPARDSTAIRRWLIGQAAESGLSKVGAFMFPGLIGPVTAGVATIFVPGDIAHEIPWAARCSEGPVYGITVGF